MIFVLILTLISILSLNGAPVIKPLLTVKEETAVNVNGTVKEEAASRISFPWLPLSPLHPRGTIVMVTLNNIDQWFTESGTGTGEYTGWYICDGRNRTPDLRGRFLVGRDSRNSDFIDVGKTGGTSYVQLDEKEMPSHTHNDNGHKHTISLSTSESGFHDHPYNDIFFSENRNDGYDWVSVPNGWGYKGSSDNNNVGHQMIRQTSAAGFHTHNMNGETYAAPTSIDATGGNQAHENRPPYYVVVYIVYLGLEQ